MVFVSTMTVPPPEKRRHSGTPAFRVRSRSTSSAALPDIPRTMAVAASDGILAPVSEFTLHEAPRQSHSFVISQLRLSARKSASSRRSASNIGTLRRRSRRAGGLAREAHERARGKSRRRWAARGVRLCISGTGYGMDICTKHAKRSAQRRTQHDARVLGSTNREPRSARSPTGIPTVSVRTPVRLRIHPRTIHTRTGRLAWFSFTHRPGRLASRFSDCLLCLSSVCLYPRGADPTAGRRNVDPNEYTLLVSYVLYMCISTDFALSRSRAMRSGSRPSARRGVSTQQDAGERTPVHEADGAGMDDGLVMPAACQSRAVGTSDG